MASVTQMSFQNKAVERLAFLFRNDCHVGPPSGAHQYLSLTSHYSHPSLAAALEHWSLGNSLVSGPWTVVIPHLTFRNPLIYPVLTLSKLNKKFLFDRFEPFATRVSLRGFVVQPVSNIHSGV